MRHAFRHYHVGSLYFPSVANLTGECLDLSLKLRFGLHSGWIKVEVKPSPEDETEPALGAEALLEHQR